MQGLCPLPLLIFLHCALCVKAFRRCCLLHHKRDSAAARTSTTCLMSRNAQSKNPHHLFGVPFVTTSSTLHVHFSQGVAFGDELDLKGSQHCHGVLYCISHLLAGAKSRKWGSSSDAASSAVKPATTIFRGWAGGARAVAMSTFAKRPNAAALARFCWPPPNSQPPGALNRLGPADDSDMFKKADGALTAPTTVCMSSNHVHVIVYYMDTTSI